MSWQPWHNTELDPGAIGRAAERSHPPPAPMPAVEFPEYPDQRDLGGDLRRLNRPYQFTYKIDGTWYRQTVPAGFVHDGASIHDLASLAVPKEEFDIPGLGHDHFYRHGGKMPEGELEEWDPEIEAWVVALDEEVSRKFADRVFRHVAKRQPKRRRPSCWRRWTAYRILRRFAEYAWGPKDAPEVP